MKQRSESFQREAQLIDVDKKRRERDLKKKQIRGTRFKKQLIMFFALILILGGAVKVLFSPYFDLKNIQVIGNKKVNTKDIFALARPYIGENLFSLSSDNISHNISKFSWIKDVNIDKKLPDKIIIRVEEEKPSYTLESQGKMWLLSTNYRVLALAPTGSANIGVALSTNLPSSKIKLGKTVKNRAITNAFMALDSLDSSIKKRIRKIEAKTMDDFNFVLDKKNIQVYYGNAENRVKKSAVLKSILKEIESKRLNVYYIDVRAVMNPVIKKIPSIKDIQKNG